MRFRSGSQLGHHNALAGIDAYKHYGALIVVGRTAPSPAAVERTAEALTGRAVTPIEGWYDKVPINREMADGSLVSGSADRHPDPVCEAIRATICEDELVQIIGRVRGTNRTEAIRHGSGHDEHDLPIPITQLVAAADLAPTPQDLMLGTAGVAFTNCRHVAQAYPQLWLNPNAAKLALHRATSGLHFRISMFSIRLCNPLVPNPTPFPYQLVGERQKQTTAFYDPHLETPLT